MGSFVQKGFGGGPCVPRYYVNGMIEPSSPLAYYDPVKELDRRYSPQQLRGIEVHTASEAPVQFPADPRSGCGVVLIWTK